MWSIALVAKESRLVVGSSDRQLRVWSVDCGDAEKEVGGATSRVVIGHKRAPLLDDGDMSDNDVTEKYERNVRMFRSHNITNGCRRRWLNEIP